MQKNSVETQKFILKFFPEIMIKGSSAKRQMVGQLYNNLIAILTKINSEVIIKKHSDKLEVFTPIIVLDEVKQKLLDTSGIEQVLEVLQFDAMDTIEKIKIKVGELVIDSLKGKTFAVRVKRTGKHSFTSLDIEKTVGGYLLAHSKAKGVQLKNPEITVQMEVMEKQLNFISARYKGLSGFPIGTQGDILSLMSGGFDSTVASYLTMKRGIKTHFVFFNLGGIAHEIGVKQVAFYLWSKFGSSHKVKFISVPFDDVLTEIFRSTPPTYMGVVLKRLMLMASEKIADELEIDALLTGESVAQVSSQTLRNLALIDEVSNKLILRPLSTMNKPEIISIANDIGTRQFAESMPEYCGVISQNPIIYGSFKRMEKVAKKFDYEVLNKAVEDAKHIYVHDIIDDIKNLDAVEVVSELKQGDFIVIDIREEDECIETSCESIKIPFHKLKSEFPKLDKEKDYLLYCEKGVMSQLHAQYLRDEYKCENVKVYRPIK
ncbi:tRNA 4-thiouridine(8) synthase ThiI [Sulfurimonas sp. SAG-AH-194-I05]|nr:tRNA uracil 4-sulfurtransferase ThiI [Sulfurimonas sp. SAG-AH-194-I05]MDF1876065.1 tRNA 4-thiouridine(8) synthase ThiI [Sulfurimonas sp. SAG-AH-194-I05]